MKSIIYTIVISAVLFISLGLVSCGGDPEIKNLKNAIENSTSELETIDATRNYLFYVVFQEQDNQKKNPKKINAENLLDVRDTLMTVGETYPIIFSSINVRINQATLSMLLGAYSESKSELVEAVEFVQEGVDIFDTLMRDYPNNMAVRAYRIINYSNLPNVFGKEKIVEKDVSLFLPFFGEASELPAFEKGLFQAVIDRLDIYYSEAGNTDRVAEVKQAMEYLQNMETGNDSASIINQ